MGKGGSWKKDWLAGSQLAAGLQKHPPPPASKKGTNTLNGPQRHPPPPSPGNKQTLQQSGPGPRGLQWTQWGTARTTAGASRRASNGEEGGQTTSNPTQPHNHCVRDLNHCVSRGRLFPAAPEFRLRGVGGDEGANARLTPTPPPSAPFCKDCSVCRG